MGWFERTYHRITKGKKKIDVPDGLWTKCANCSEIIYNKNLNENLKVCPKCGYHFYLGARERIQITVDERSFTEYNAEVSLNDPLNFPEYKEKLSRGREKNRFG